MQINTQNKKVIKFKSSRLKETLDFFEELGFIQKSSVKARRISYELGNVDFDIDVFPEIPPFLEIDIENISNESYTLESILESLGLENNKVVTLGTEDIHKVYGVDYYSIYSKNDNMKKK